MILVMLRRFRRQRSIPPNRSSTFSSVSLADQAKLRLIDSAGEAPDDSPVGQRPSTVRTSPNLTLMALRKLLMSFPCSGCEIPSTRRRDTGVCLRRRSSPATDEDWQRSMLRRNNEPRPITVHHGDALGLPEGRVTRPLLLRDTSKDVFLTNGEPTCKPTGHYPW